MFSRLSALILAVPFLVSASVVPRTNWGGNSVNQCNVGAMQCCNDVQHSSSTTVQETAGLFGVNLGGVDSLVGLGCTPILSAAKACSAQPVCCSNNSFNGVIAVGCTPINVL